MHRVQVCSRVCIFRNNISNRNCSYLYIPIIRRLKIVLSRPQTFSNKNSTNKAIKAHYTTLNEIKTKRQKTQNGNYKHEYLERAFEDARRKKVPLSIINYGIYLNFLAKLGDFQKAEEVIHEMKKQNIQVDVIAYTTLMRAYLKKNNIKEAKQIIYRMKDEGLQLDSVVYDTLMNWYVQAGQIENARKLFLEMKESGIKPCIHSYSILAKGYAQHKKYELVQQITNEMKNEGIHLDCVFYGIVIHMFLQNDEFDRAYKIFSACKNEMKIGPEIYNLFIQYYLKKEKLEDIQRVYSWMEKEGVVPDKRTISMLLSSLVKKGDPQKAKEMFENMKKKYHFHPDLVIYSNLVEAECKLGNMEEAMVILNRMQEEGFTPSEVTIGSIITGFSKKGEMEKSLKLLEEIETKFGVRPNVNMYSAIINGFAKKGDIKNAETILEKMKQIGIEPNSYTYTSLMNAYTTSCQYDKALQIFEKIKKETIPQIHSFHIALKIYLLKHDEEMVVKLLKEMEKFNLKPDVYTFNSIIHYFINQNNYEKAKEWFKVMRIAKVNPNKFTKRMRKLINSEIN